MGAMVSVHVAGHHPELVRSVWVSGAAFLPRSPLLAYGFALRDAINDILPNRLIDSLIDFPPEQRARSTGAAGRPMTIKRSVAGFIGARIDYLAPNAAGTKTQLAERGVRLAAIAATRGDWLVPSNDSTHVAKTIAGELGGTAWAVPSMRHA